jgi:membrane protease subunit HflK
MKRMAWLSAALLACYLATGLYVVRGNEQALVERMGRLARVSVPSGLHADLPWPWSRVRCVNVYEVRVLAVGGGDPALRPLDAALRDASGPTPAEFLTADKNILHIQAALQYRIAQPVLWLYNHANPEAELASAAETQLAHAVAQSGVDYVHPLGLNQLSQLVAESLGPLADSMGAAIESFAIAGVFPPVEVKGAFLDVSNARAERDRLLEFERSRAEQRMSAARAAALQALDRAESYRYTRVETARGAADRFDRLVDRMAQEATATGVAASLVRQRAMRRRLLETLEEILPSLRGRVVVDGGGPVDLTIIPGEDPFERSNKPSNGNGISKGKQNP